MGKSHATSESPAQDELPASLVAIRATSVKTFGLVWILSVLLCFPIYALLAVRWVTYYRSSNGAWLDFLYRQKDVLLDRRAGAGHRIIVVGGSNALFGIDAELIERKLHIPAVNYGTHGGMGISYMLDRVSRKMQHGDIILLDPEYDIWNDLYRDDPGPAFSYIWTYDKPYLGRMPFRETARMIANIPLSDWTADVYSDKARSDLQYKNLEAFQAYHVSSTDPCGDMLAVVRFAPARSRGYFFPSTQSYGFVALRAFAAEAKRKNVRLMMTWPNFMRPTPSVPSAKASPPPSTLALLSDLGVTLLNTPLKTTFPPSWFMDSAYHTNPCCRRVRTEELIERMRPELGLPRASEKVSGIFLVAGYQHRLSDGNLFADDPGVRVRYLREQPEGDPRAMVPAQVAQSPRQGNPGVHGQR